MDRRILTLIIAAGLALALVAGILIARGGGSDSGSGDSGSGDLTDLSSKPKVEVPSGPPPQQLETKDLVTGDGAEAKSGDTVKVQYVGVVYETGKEFDASWDRGQPFSFKLGWRPGDSRLGPGRRGDAGRRPPRADHPAGPRLRRRRARRRRFPRTRP